MPDPGSRADTFRVVLPFAAATLMPAGLLTVAALMGGVWIWLALGTLTVAVALLDHIIPPPAHESHRADTAETVVAPFPDGSPAPVTARRDGPEASAEFPASAMFSVLLGFAHFWVLALGIDALASVDVFGPDAPATGLWSWAGLWSALGLWLGFGLWLGQIGHANAHELIHRSRRWPHRLGVAVYVSLLFGHHASAHRLVHHVHVATQHDPNSARRGLGFYAFALQAWVGSFRSGLRAERARDGRRPWGAWGNPYLVYLGGAGLCIASVLMVWGWRGMVAYLALASHAQIQILLSDYVQHYGLRRHSMADGRTEPVGLRHAWNAAPVLSGWQLLNGARHSDHHTAPARPYPALALPDANTAPRLPRSLPVMAGLALIPPLWRRVMDPRADAWAHPPAPRGSAGTRET